MVHATAVERLRGERLRVGMIGGGRNAFVGVVHRMAMRLDDLIELRPGALPSDGMLAASQVAVGNLNSLSLNVYGSRAGVEWAGEEPETLRFAPYGEPSRILRRGGPGNTPLAVEGSRMPGGAIPKGYVEGFANLYRGAAEVISARRAGRTPEKSAKLTPNVLDGARGVAFIEAAVKSSENNGVWTSISFD